MMTLFLPLASWLMAVRLPPEPHRPARRLFGASQGRSPPPLTYHVPAPPAPAPSRSFLPPWGSPWRQGDN